jgi:hypothetical protein
VTGFRGSYCAGRLDHWINWTIHWDYDPIKGPHVNLLIQDNFMNETLRFAYCESHGPHPYGRAPETQSHEFMLNRLTSDWLQLQLLDRYSGQEGWCGSKCIPGRMWTTRTTDVVCKTWSLTRGPICAERPLCIGSCHQHNQGFCIHFCCFARSTTCSITPPHLFILWLIHNHKVQRILL